MPCHEEGSTSEQPPQQGHVTASMEQEEGRC